jgi:thioredoxin reductase/Fe-S-cluster-containing hydrogenase component 2
MKRYDLVIVGAGPSGLSAAIEAAGYGMKTVVYDENSRPGGQLFKQIHKFFGSKEHHAKIRGFRIGEELLQEASAAGVEVQLESTVTGIYEDKEVTVQRKGHIEHVKGDTIIVATGASENMVPFEGWDLPGVIGAGAAQTMMNLHGVKPGEKVLMLGSGNVGLVVSFQLMQAGCEVVALVDAAPAIGGYGVHAAKLARCGVPFYLSHTITKAEGTDHVTGVVISQVNGKFQKIPGTEKHFDADTICVAVGLSPMSQLLKMSGCTMADDPKRGGQVPETDEYGETSVSGVYAAGDVSGIEEASSAMIEGRISGVRAAYQMGFVSEEDEIRELTKLKNDLLSLRRGMFAPGNKGKKIEKTEEGIDVSQNLLTKGYLSEAEIFRYPGICRKKGLHPVIECSQNIPCNPCQDACRFSCINVGKDITSLPVVNPLAKCSGCGMCVASCSGQAIFLVDEDYDETGASVTLPYEFFPLPKVGDQGYARNRAGEIVCKAEVISVKSSPAYDRTNLLTIRVPKDMAMKARFYADRAETKAETAGGAV